MKNYENRLLDASVRYISQNNNNDDDDDDEKIIRIEVKNGPLQKVSSSRGGYAYKSSWWTIIPVVVWIYQCI